MLYFYSPYKMLIKSVLCVLLVFGFSFVFLTLKYEIAFAGESIDSFEQRIVSLTYHNKLQEAMAATDEYLNKYGNKKECWDWVHNAKGVILSKMHEYTKAIYAYQESIKYFDVPTIERWIILTHIGDLQHALGDYTDAISYYEESIQVMDSHVPSRYMPKMFIAWSIFYLSQGMDTNSLKQVYEETKPDLREIEDHLNIYWKGKAYSMASSIAFQLGRFDEAVQFDKTVLNIHNDAFNLHNIDSDRLSLAIDLVYLKREVEANEAFRRVLLGKVTKSSLSLWHWLKGDEMLSRRYLEEYFAEECSSDVAQENAKRVIRLNEILPHDMWKDARKKKWFRDLVYTDSLDYSTEQYTNIPEHETREDIETYNNGNLELENSAAVYTDKFSNVFHRRDCSKLNDSEGLIKFDTSQKASRNRGLPCNYCKP